MSEPVGRSRRDSDPEEVLAGLENRWVLPIAVTTIVLSLILLVVIPLLVERQLSELRTDRLEAVDLAARETNEFAFAWAREMALIGEASRGDSAALSDLTRMRTREAEALRRLGELDEQLPTRVRGPLRELRRVASSRENGGGSAPDTAGGPINVSRETLRREAELELAALRYVRESLDAARGQILLQIVRAERYALAGTIGLAALALLSTGLVVWLGRRVRRLAEAARRGQLEALRAGRARTRLMRGFSHDLKNPLGAITLSAELLQSGMHGQLSGEQQEAVERMERAARQGLALLNDLLELSQAEAGRLHLKAEALDPGELLQRIGDEYSSRAEEAGLTLRIDSAAPVPVVVADARRVRQILENLVANAINYTPHGGSISLSLSSTSSGPDGRAGSWVGWTVADTGRGIAREHLETVFDEFARLPGVEGRRSGTGIGLAISRQLARLMKGDITLESEPGRGSRFTLWLPR